MGPGFRREAWRESARLIDRVAPWPAPCKIESLNCQGNFVSDLRYNIEVTPPDISAYRAGNTGIDYFTTFTAREAGPHVAVLGLTHGNEICGAIAIDKLLRAGVQPRRGKLTLGFNNVAAYLEFDTRYPIASRYIDEDFNRLWSPATLDGPRNSVELQRARA